MNHAQLLVYLELTNKKVFSKLPSSTKVAILLSFCTISDFPFWVKEFTNS